jgi:hypothetical protein
MIKTGLWNFYLTASKPYPFVFSLNNSTANQSIEISYPLVLASFVSVCCNQRYRGFLGILQTKLIHK